MNRNLKQKCVKGFVAAILAEDYKFANLFLQQAINNVVKEKIQNAKDKKIFNP